MIFSALLATALAAPTVDPTTMIRVALFGSNEQGDACYYVENREGRLGAIVQSAMFYSTMSYFYTFNHNSADPKIVGQTQRGDIYDFEIEIDVASLLGVAKNIPGGLQGNEGRTWLNKHVHAAVAGYVKNVALNYPEGKWTANVRLVGAQGFKFDIVPEQSRYSFSSPVLKQLEQKIPNC
jgi:hypothetical protein